MDNHTNYTGKCKLGLHYLYIFHMLMLMGDQLWAL